MRPGLFLFHNRAMHAQIQPGTYALGRVAIAPGLSESAVPYSYYGVDPFFVVGSAGDGCFKKSAGGEGLEYLVDERLGPVYVFPSAEQEIKPTSPIHDTPSRPPFAYSPTN